jgi:uncharacterized protein (DUF433 family)
VKTLGLCDIMKILAGKEMPMLRAVKIVDRGRGPQLDSCRITVYDIIPYLEEGDSPNLIASTLLISTNKVQALMKYIEEHRDEVMEVHREIEERIGRGNPPEIQAKLDASYARLRA